MNYGENLIEIGEKTAEIWPVEYCHTFSVIWVSVQTETQITENVWKYLIFIKLISKQIFAQILSNFHRL